MTDQVCRSWNFDIHVMIFRLLKVIADDARIGNKQSNLNDYLKGNMWQYVAICDFSPVKGHGR